ncbi:KH domain-containing protein [Bdellovibrio svalbardensis]|uniref:KH domain-containing protein n=1 Tax=Bdellovibrio svalbardensis TaxID=2972972 RepID=A0ABT6DGV9_9BACT|nr:KH domain-containing protein [Bdellovibrio svalbardensis]MDG0816075.1 KH domain-containing protein [Bdellovibrio svalbardensis]
MSSVPVVKVVNRTSATTDAHERIRNILHHLLAELVGSEETLAVKFYVGEKTVVYQVDCTPQALGRVIGTKGKNITAVRHIIGAMMSRNGMRAVIEIPYFPSSGK